MSQENQPTIEQVDDKFTKNIADAVQNVFSTMLMMEPVLVKTANTPGSTIGYDVSGVISIAGDFRGYVIASFPKELALNIVNGFVGIQPADIDDDVVDSIGEVTNLIAGSAKRAFVELGYKYIIGIPNVVCGKNHVIKRSKQLPFAILTFEIDGVPFNVEVALKIVQDR